MPNDVLFVGHSLVGHTMPRMLDALLTTAQVREQVINGSPLAYNWDHGDTAEGVNARAALASCAYGTLILTEAIPLAGHIEWSNTYGIARAYGQTAWAANPATRVMIYETWHEMGADTALWRDNLTTDLALWQGIAAHVNAQKPGAAPTVGIVPGGQAMGLLYDSIAAGRGLGLTDIRQLFTDTIHPNDAGNYLISLVQYAAITGRSAVGLTGSLMGEWGQPYTGWTAEQTVLFQHIAWEAAARAPGARLASGTALPQLLLGTAGNDALTGGTGDDRLYGANGNDVLTGGKGHDLMAGERGNDRLTGAAGNDFLLGGQGHDLLFGNGGNDRLSGEAGNDALAGGAGADGFVFARGAGADRIADFTLSQGDRLLFDDALWSGNRSAAQVVSSFARVTAEGVLFDFGANGSVLVQGLSSTAGLAGQIDIL